MSALSEPAVAWRVHLGTAAMTCVRLRLPPAEPGAPWPMTRVVSELALCGATRSDRPHALGAGRGVPLVHRQELEWGGCALHLEAHHIRGEDEICLELPPWDELVMYLESEESFWDVIDTVATASEARFGAIGDGESLEEAAPDLGRHVGVIVAESDAAAYRGTPTYTILPGSGLAVLLR